MSLQRVYTIRFKIARGYVVFVLSNSCIGKIAGKILVQYTKIPLRFRNIQMGEMRMQFWQTKLKTYLYTLQMEERSGATIKAYARHIGQFLQFTGTGPLKKPVLLSYKQHLLEKGYQPATVNTMLVPVNGFLTFVGKGECPGKAFKNSAASLS